MTTFPARNLQAYAEARRLLNEIGGSVEATEVEYHLSPEHVGELLLGVAREEIEVECLFALPQGVGA